MIAEVGGPIIIDVHYASLTTQGVVDWEFQNGFSFASILHMHSLIPVKHQGMALVKVEPKKICKLNKLEHFPLNIVQFA